MKILDVTALALPGVQVVRYGRFADARGYFTEHFRQSDFRARLPFLEKVEFLQTNESYSRAGTVRGLHFQWNPHMGKLVRPMSGRMVDLVLDIRKGSPTYGRIIAYDMPTDPMSPHGEWIWVPPGFAHGSYFPIETTIEYFCSGEYSPGCEAGLSPLAADLDWSLCEPALAREIRAHLAGTPLLSDKDRGGLTLAAWSRDPRAGEFVYGAC